jgi:putative transcriptional regulator
LNLSSKIKELREERGWTQHELSKRSGVDRSTVAYIETDRIAKPSAETFLKLAQAFDIHINELFASAGYIKDIRTIYSHEQTAEQILDEIKLNLRRLEKKLKEKTSH